MLLASLLLLAAGTPSGWWIVDASNGVDVGLPGAAWQFTPEIVAVDAARTGLRRTPLDCVATSYTSWHCERTVSSGIHVLDLRLRDGILSGTIGRIDRDSYGAFNARRATAAEAKSLDAFAELSKVVDAKSCAQTKACFQSACPMFGNPKDPCIFEQQGMSRDGPSCRAYLPMLVATLKQLGEAVPAACTP